MAGKLYVLERAVLDTLTIGGTTVAQLTEGLQTTLDSGASQLDPHHFTVGRFAPLLTLDTLDVKAVMDVAWGSSRVVPHIPIDPTKPLYLYLSQVADGGTRSGGSTNIRLIIYKGVIELVGVRAGEGMRAVLSLRVHCDGSSSGYAIETGTGVALPAGSGGPAAIWRVAGIINNTDGSNTIRRVREFSLDFGIGVSRALAASHLEPLDSSVDRFAPTAQFTTEALKSVLDWTGVTNAVAAGAGFRFVLAPYTAGGIGFASAGGISFDFLAGSMIVPRTVGFDHGAGATINCDVLGIGTETGLSATYRPLSYSTGVTCPIDSPDAADSQRYGPGPCFDNTTLITELVSGSISFGCETKLYYAMSVPWPVHGCVTRRTPMCSFSALNGDFYETLIGTRGRAVDTSFRIFMRKHTADGHGVADATASHIKFAFDGGMIMPAGIGGQSDEMQRHGFTVTNVTNAAMTLATASAIS